MVGLVADDDDEMGSEGVEIDASDVASDESRTNGGESCGLAGACVICRGASCIAIGSARVRALGLAPS